MASDKDTAGEACLPLFLGCCLKEENYVVSDVYTTFSERDYPGKFVCLDRHRLFDGIWNIEVDKFRPWRNFHVGSLFRLLGDNSFPSAVGSSCSGCYNCHGLLWGFGRQVCLQALERCSEDFGPDQRYRCFLFLAKLCHRSVLCHTSSSLSPRLVSNAFIGAWSSFFAPNSCGAINFLRFDVSGSLRGL